MNEVKIEKTYNKYYRSIDFERLGLFKYIKKEFNPDTVLYLGSATHISPSFIFQNVTYVDKDPVVETFLF